MSYQQERVVPGWVRFAWTAALVCILGGVVPAIGKAADAAHADAPHPHDPFEELQDSWHWPILKSLGLEFHLPHWGGGGTVVLFEGISKFMILELIAAGLILAIYVPLSKRVASGAPARGPWDNAFESVLTFIRNDIAKPNLGEHDADRYTPFLWTLFLFILFNNLLGMFPYMGSPTANLYVTGALALCSFGMMHGAAIANMGLGHYLQAQWPHMDVPFGMGYFLKPMIFAIEMLGTVIKSGVLAVRLFANMFAGHTVLAMILAFIVTAAGASLTLWGRHFAGERLGCGGAKSLGVVRGVSPGVYFCVFDSAVHGDGASPSALARTRPNHWFRFG